MMRFVLWLSAVSALLVICWQECGENLAVFCYRMSWVAFSTARTRANEFAPAHFATARAQAACSNPSSTSCIPSMMLKD